MDSPVQIPFKSFITLSQNDASPVYLQIVFEFIKAIQMGLLPEGTKLPGTRELCKVLAVNRNTLIKSFQDLESQGWIEIIPNKGTFILSQTNDSMRTEINLRADRKTPKVNPSFDFSRSTILENPIENTTLPYRFNDGLPDIRLIQTDVLARLYVTKLKRQSSIKTWEQLQNESHHNFKTTFSNYLNLTRGIRIGTANLLTTASHELSLYLVAKVLLAKGDKVVVAAPGYYKSNMTLSDAGAHIIPIPTDKGGISTRHLKNICNEHSIRALYLTSNYHYPTTTPLSAKRRIELFELAHQYGFVVIEDDYDYDFHYDNNPVLPLAAFDANDRVIYVGSFGRSLPAGFGYGFVAASAEFIAELEKHHNIMEPGVDVIKEQALTDWINNGEVHRLSKKNKKAYRDRRDYFIKLLNDNLKGKIKFSVPARGLAIWVEWLNSFNLIQLQKECAKNGLFLPKTILYQTKNLTATRLGFGHLSPDEMEQTIAILSRSFDTVFEENTKLPDIF